MQFLTLLLMHFRFTHAGQGHNRLEHEKCHAHPSSRVGAHAGIERYKERVENYAKTETDGNFDFNRFSFW